MATDFVDSSSTGKSASESRSPGLSVILLSFVLHACSRAGSRYASCEGQDVPVRASEISELKALVGQLVANGEAQRADNEAVRTEIAQIRAICVDQAARLADVEARADLSSCFLHKHGGIPVLGWVFLQIALNPRLQQQHRYIWPAQELAYMVDVRSVLSR